MKYTFTSESVSEGHPDKVADLISDSILDAHLAQDPLSRVACEVLVKGSEVVVAGEITSSAGVDIEKTVRAAISEIGYTDAGEAFSAEAVRITELLTTQCVEIGTGVDRARDSGQGAGDQGIMFGFATNETPELMPLPIALAHKLCEELSRRRKSGAVDWLRPDSKTQVSVEYEDDLPVRVTDVLVSTQHAARISTEEITELVDQLVREVLGDWTDQDTRLLVNPTGSFVNGGPSVDCGLTGRKIIVDTYGGMGRHGGGAFSGKDPSKVDRSGAYFCRYVAKKLVEQGIVNRAELQVSYAIGVAQPVSIKVETFGTGNEAAAREFVSGFDFRPAAIIERLDLLRPIYRASTNYGHFGRKGLPWEE
ncbi:MAG: methionine adenosyltransferase [Acidobacteriota bacterium]|nr:MAG: methionine adenosyltransferase [Acidobacteriota bacterium]